MALLSVIVPSFNEELNIANTASVLTEILDKEPIDYEILFVDDGSRDKTYAEIQKVASENPHIRGIGFSRNFGKEAAIFAGLSEAKGDCCVLTDCDLQFPPECIPKMLRLWEQGYEVVEGKKANRGDEKLLYRLSAESFYRVISRITKIDMKNSSDFKLLDRKVVDVLTALPEHSTFFRALSFWSGFKTAEIEFEVQKRQFGQTKWSLTKLIRYAFVNICSFTTAPLQIVTGIGCVLLLFMAVLAVQTLVNFFMGQAAEGFTTVIILQLLIGGSILMGLGIIGFYISKIYEEVKGRPRYIISKRTEEEK